MMKDQKKPKEDLIQESAESQHPLTSNGAEGTVLRRALAETQEARKYARNIVQTIREPLLVLDANLKVLSANRSFYTVFRVEPGTTVGSYIYDLGNRQWDIPGLRELLENILPRNITFDDFEVEHDFPTIGHKSMMLNARQIRNEELGSRMILLAIEDITGLRKLERERRNILSMFAHDMKNPLVTSKGFLSRIISGKAGAVTEKQQNYLEIIRHELNNLSQLVSDFLDFSKFLSHAEVALCVFLKKGNNEPLKASLSEGQRLLRHAWGTAALLNRFGFRNRQRKVKCCTFIRLSLSPYAPAVLLDYVLDDDKSDAGPLNFLFGMYPLKKAEEPIG
jgi:signal transduction histidine kinase